MSAYRWDHDRTHSDGMCGRVALVDPETGRRAEVGWSVTGKVDSQSAAADEARRRLDFARIQNGPTTNDAK